MAFNYSKLKGRIVEKFQTQGRFAVAMGMSERSLSLKLRNKREFKQSEIDKACRLLEIPIEKTPEYFFAA